MAGEYAANGTMLRRYFWGPDANEPVLWTQGMGIDRTAPVADALLQVYGTPRRQVLNSAQAFDAAAIASLRADFIDTAGATGSSRP